MNCELCGFGDKKFYLAEIEGAELKVCSECSKFGRIIREINEDGTLHSDVKVIACEEKRFKDNLGAIITDAIKASGITLAELSHSINTAESTIEKIASGKILPTAEIAKKIEHKLKLSLSEVDTPYRSDGNAPTRTDLKFENIVNIKKKQR